MQGEGGPLSEVEVDHIDGQTHLKVAEPVAWVREGHHVKAVVSVVGVGVNTNLVMDLLIKTKMPGQYTYQLRQKPGVNLRRLDVRGSHTNRAETGNEEVWRFRTHKHRFRDRFEDTFAYTPDDIPDTASSPLCPEPDEHGRVFDAFCAECGIDPAGQWTDPPLGLLVTPTQLAS